MQHRFCKGCDLTFPVGQEWQECPCCGQVTSIGSGLPRQDWKDQMEFKAAMWKSDERKLREERLESMGLGGALLELIAATENVSISEFRSLLERGCPAHLAAAILL